MAGLVRFTLVAPKKHLKSICVQNRETSLSVNFKFQAQMWQSLCLPPLSLHPWGQTLPCVPSAVGTRPASPLHRSLSSLILILSLNSGLRGGTLRCPRDCTVHPCVRCPRSSSHVYLGMVIPRWTFFCSDMCLLLLCKVFEEDNSLSRHACNPVSFIVTPA